MTETCVIERGRERCRRNTCIWLALRAKKGREHVLVSVEPTRRSGTHKFKYGTIPPIRVCYQEPTLFATISFHLFSINRIFRIANPNKKCNYVENLAITEGNHCFLHILFFLMHLDPYKVSITGQTLVGLVEWLRLCTFNYV